MRKRLLSIIYAATVSCTIFFTASGTKAATLQERVWGNDRYQTNSKIVESGWASSEYAVIASGEGFADALCAAPLAQQNKAPILLTSKHTLNIESKKQLSRLKVKKVFIIGGIGVVSDNVKSEIESMGIETTRIYGQDRFETSVEVAKNLKNVSGVVVTNGYGFADALSIAPVAAQKCMPILLTDKAELPTVTKDFLANKTLTETYIVGGTGVVSDKIASQLKNNTRLGGNSRYGTNSAVLNHFADKFGYDKVYVASGENYPDALSGSVLAASSNSPLILVGNSIDPSVMYSVKDQHDKYNNVIVLGGTGVVSDTSANNIVSGVVNTVIFKDNILEQIVRKEINKPTGDIYKSDVENITYLEAGEKGIQDISGIENLTNLQHLVLYGNSISNIDALKDLTNLNNIDLSVNKISDINPLKRLTNLNVLDLENNQLKDISALKELTNLHYLYLDINQISDISVIKGFVNLQYISLTFNQISDISALKGLSNLEYIVLNDNQISDISALEGMTNLDGLYLNRNQISDINALKGLTSLEILELDTNKISDITPLKQLNNLAIVWLADNKISDTDKQSLRNALPKCDISYSKEK